MSNRNKQSRNMATVPKNSPKSSKMPPTALSGSRQRAVSVAIPGQQAPQRSNDLRYKTLNGYIQRKMPMATDAQNPIKKTSPAKRKMETSHCPQNPSYVKEPTSEQETYSCVLCGNSIAVKQHEFRQVAGEPTPNASAQNAKPINLDPWLYQEIIVGINGEKLTEDPE